MATLGSFDNNIQWPREVGWILCTCTAVGKGKSSKKQTPYVELFWQGVDGSFFNDQLYVTPKAIGRLAIVAQRVCGLPKDYELSDKKEDAVVELARVIVSKAQGCNAMVYVEEYTEDYMVQDGPDVGQMRKIKKHRVAPFTGYKKPEDHKEDTQPQEPPKQPEQMATPPQDDLPF